jgi:hypothetical protein
MRATKKSDPTKVKLATLCGKKLKIGPDGD